GGPPGGGLRREGRRQGPRHLHALATRRAAGVAGGPGAASPAAPGPRTCRRHRGRPGATGTTAARGRAADDAAAADRPLAAVVAEDRESREAGTGMRQAPPPKDEGPVVDGAGVAALSSGPSATASGWR